MLWYQQIQCGNDAYRLTIPQFQKIVLEVLFATGTLLYWKKYTFQEKMK